MKIFKHAFTMVGRTRKSYALLSVTILLSFSLLLGYLTYSDSTIYNQYKELFSYRREDVMAWIPDANEEKLRLLMENLEEMPDTGYYIAYYYELGYLSTDYTLVDPTAAKEISDIPSLLLNAWLLPDHSWPDDCVTAFGRGYEKMDIVWLDGGERSELILAANEVIVSLAIYQLLELDQQSEPVFALNCQYGQKIPLKVVGYTANVDTQEWLDNTKIGMYTADLILSTKFIQYAQLNNESLWRQNGYPKCTGTYAYICSKTPEQVVTLLETMGYTHYYSVYQRQNDALDAIRPQKQVKAIIACGLLLLLGINLYSSFTNALNERKFEIGVKRAIGASGWSIIRQFLYESVLVMAANVLLSIALVADVAIVYKFIMDRIYGQYVLYISDFSIAMFAVCAVTLTVVFSLVFAYKSTRVEIVRYLKAE